MKKSKYTCFLILLLLLSSLLNSYPVQAAQTEDYSLSMTKTDLLLNDSATLSVEGVTDEEISFKSEDNSIVSVGTTENNSCELTGEAVGKTTVTVRIKKKGAFFFMNAATTLRCKVTVSPRAVSVKFKKKQYKLAVGAKKTIPVILRPSITTEVPAYTSSDPSIATINAKGRVTAAAKGTAVISATIKNGMTVRCKIIVIENKTDSSKTNKAAKSK